MKRSKWRRAMMSVVVTAGGGTLFGGCNTELAREFRSVAGVGLQDGVTTIANSLIDGVFAILEPNPTTDDSR